MAKKDIKKVAPENKEQLPEENTAVVVEDVDVQSTISDDNNSYPTEKVIENKEQLTENKELTELEFKLEGKKYKFVKSAPARIRFEGKRLTQSEIIANEDILIQLVGGKSNLIKAI